MTLTRPTLVALFVLTIWLGLDFIGIDGLVGARPILTSAGLLLAVLFAIGILGLLRVRFMAPLFGLVLLIWGALQIETHWSTYILSPDHSKLVWYERLFGDQWMLLPAREGHTTPNGYHTILAGLILLNLVLTARDMNRKRKTA